MHVHTPRSVCYSDKSVTAGDIVTAALGSGLDIMAVTDHNSAAGITEIREAAGGSNLVIIPGVELTTRNGHFLAYFDVDTSVESLDDFLDRAGIAISGRGDAHTVADKELEEILKIIRESGGIAIAAHIDRWPSGFLETKDTRTRKREIYENEYLDAVEITIPGNRQAWNDGRMRGYPMKRACVQGSDAHNPGEIGRRPVYLKMEDINLESMRKTLDNYESDISFPEDIDDKG